MIIDLTGRNAVVTGSSGNLGRAIAEGLARRRRRGCERSRR
jgi:NAD(P)-dependent dehydrogenase (short-subunit alcohol dehydrogenase family)